MKSNRDMAREETSHVLSSLREYFLNDLLWKCNRRNSVCKQIRIMYTFFRGHYETKGTYF